MSKTPNSQDDFRTRNSREAMLRYQQSQLKKLLRYVWQRSAFYREYYAGHGVRESDLADLAVSDLPLLPKKTLIDNFDKAVTDARLKKAELEEWFESHRDPEQPFCKDMVVIHGSGTSGDLGIFAYDRAAWATADAMVSAHLPMPENYSAGKTRIAFYVAADGHFATVSMAASMPRNVYDTLILSLLDPSERTISELNAFQPHRLTGYSSAIAYLAELALADRLQIHPTRVFVGGDKLTASMETKIREAWNAPIYVMYAASESKYIALKLPERVEMMVLDELNIVEVLDETNQTVAEGREGRVVLTNLYNYTLPILRYELGDFVVKGTTQADSPYSTLRDIRGRVNDALPVTLADGRSDTIHPIVLTTFYAPTMEKFQFVSKSPQHVRIDYIASQEIDIAVREEFQKMLNAKEAVGTTFEVRRVSEIANDPKTGKLRLVRFDGAQTTRQTYAVSSKRAPAVQVSSRPEIEPAASFTPFARHEIEQSIPARFEKQVDRYSDRLAVKSGALSLSYGQLNRAANRLARAIQLRLGAKPEPVALLVSQGVSAISSILGILKAGKCYVPLDPAFPEARLVSILEEAEASLIVTCDADLPSTRALGVDFDKVLNIDTVAVDTPTDNVEPIASPDSLAYLMYTSGSTGRPKGVMQNHRNVLHQIMTYTNGLRIAADDRLTQLHSHGFSASRLDIFGPLLNGAALYPFAAAEQGMERLARWLNEEKITLLHWVPTPFRHFADSLDDSNSFPDLRLVVLGSEPLSSRDVDLYKRRFSSRCVLVNRFGTTETGNVRWHFINKETAISKGTVPVGYAVEDTEVLLLDDAGKSLGNGEDGEIAVKSRYLSPGYWRRPDLTAAAFSDSPEPETKIYRTGDTGRLLADGCLLHLGRNDFQVKIRGYRVETSEVERILLEHSAVVSAVVAARPDPMDGKRLVAYYVCADGSPPAGAMLRNFLSARLPGYMIPSAFVRLEALPLTASGKVDYQALPEADSVAADGDVKITAARTPVEAQLVEIWKSTLGVDAVGVEHDFFDLGGHSLHAMTIISRINEMFNMDISIREFFESLTIAQIAKMVDNHFGTRSREGDLLDTLGKLDSMSEEQASHLVERSAQK